MTLIGQLNSVTMHCFEHSLGEVSNIVCVTLLAANYISDFAQNRTDLAFGHCIFEWTKGEFKITR